jgi:drug/metabolite transporter (DMT)-like permease
MFRNAPGVRLLDRTPANTSDRNRAEIGLILLTLIWGVNFAIIKVALETFEPFAFNALRFPIAAAVLWGALRWQGKVPMPPREDLGRVLLLGFLGNLAYQLLFIVGMDLTLAGNASLMLATAPVWTLVLASLLGVESHGPKVWIGVVTTLVGMLFVVLGGGSSPGGPSALPLGDGLLVLAAITWSIYTVLGQGLTRKHGALAVTAWTLWIGTSGLIVLGIPALTRTNFSTAGLGAWAAVVYAGVFAIALAYLLWYRGVEAIGSSKTAAFSNLIPVVALTTAAIWLGERPTALQLGGAAIVIGGVWLTRSERDREHEGD